MSWRSMGLEPESKGAFSIAVGAAPRHGKSRQELAVEIPRMRNAVLKLWLTRDPHHRHAFADSSLEELFADAFPDPRQRERAEEKLKEGLTAVLASLFEAPDSVAATTEDSPPRDEDDEFLKV